MRSENCPGGKSSIGDESLAGLQTIKDMRLGERGTHLVILEVEHVVMTGFRCDSGGESLR